MLNNLQPDPNVKPTSPQLIEDLLSKTNASEIGETLALMLDNYIQNADVPRADLANASNLVLQLSVFFERLQNCKVQTRPEVSAMVAMVVN